jgi:hypothetical protein
MTSSWITREDIEFESPEAKQAYRERAQRILDAIQLKTPDRIPFWFQDLGYFPCKYTGITFEKAAYDPEAWFGANKKVLLDFKPDMFFNPAYTIRGSGQAYEALGTKYMKWPGHGVSPNSPHQYVEGEYMKADEYDAFINDMSDYVMRTFLPRVYGALEPFSSLPSISSLGLGLPGTSEILLRPEIQSAFRAIHQAGIESMKWSKAAGAFLKEMNSLGFPVLIGSAALIPFDMISDQFRGMRGSMLDMYRCPEKLHRAMERVLPMSINMALSGARRTGNPGVFIAVHRGADGFMSSKQFETFYWPGFQKLALTLIEEGLIPCVFFEGNCTSRLEYLRDLPKGKILGFFENTDIHKAKEMLGDVMCMAGFMPLSILQVGTPDQVKDHAKELIDVLGKGGGYIMGPKSIMDEANPELVKVWVDFTKEYGVYV